MAGFLSSIHPIGLAYIFGRWGEGRKEDKEGERECHSAEWDRIVRLARTFAASVRWNVGGDDDEGKEGDRGGRKREMEEFQRCSSGIILRWNWECTGGQ